MLNDTLKGEPIHPTPSSDHLESDSPPSQTSPQEELGHVSDPISLLDQHIEQVLNNKLDSKVVEATLEQCLVDIDPQQLESVCSSLVGDELEKAKHFETLGAFLDQDGKVATRYKKNDSCGRYYTQNPCLQNMPKMLRVCVNRPGHVIIDFDLSMAHLYSLSRTGNHEVRRLLTNGCDIYRYLARDCGMDRKTVKSLIYSYINGAGQTKLEEIARENGFSLSFNFDQMISKLWPEFIKHLEDLRNVGRQHYPKIKPHAILSHMLMRQESRWLERVLHVFHLDAKSTKLLPELVLTLHDGILCVTVPQKLYQQIELVSHVMTRCMRLPDDLSKGVVTHKYGKSWGELDNSPVPMEDRPTTLQEWRDVAFAFLSNGRDQEITPRVIASLKTLSGDANFELMVNRSNHPRELKRTIIKLCKQYRMSVLERQQKSVDQDLPTLPSQSPIDIARYAIKALFTNEGFAPCYNEEVGIRLPNFVTMSYDLVNEQVIAQKVQNLHGQTFLIGDKRKPLYMNRTTNAVEAFKTQSYDGDFTIGMSHGIASFQNGDVIFDKTTNELILKARTLDSKVLTESLFDVEHDSCSECPQFMSFLNDIWPNTMGDSVTQIEVLQEFVGLSILGLGVLGQKHLFFYGPKGSNGKSELLKIICGLFPSEVQSTVSPIDWYGFNLHGLLGARLNTISEMPSSKWLNDSTVKAILTGDPINIQRKNLISLQGVRLSAGHIITANSFPPSTTSDKAFFRRWIILPFYQEFTGEKIKRDLHRSILTSERQGIISWALKGAERFLQRPIRSFPTLKDNPILINQWKSESSSAHEFILSEVRASTSTSTSLKSIYDEYKEWCMDCGRKPYNKGKFKKLLEEDYNFPCRISSHASTRYFEVELSSHSATALKPPPNPFGLRDDILD